jgi:hypothetical protein
MRVRRLLTRVGLGPAPRRSGPSRCEFLRSQAASIVACDFITVESVLLRRYHVLFFIAPQPAASGSQAAPLTPPARGSPSRRATSASISRTRACAC